MESSIRNAMQYRQNKIRHRPNYISTIVFLIWDKFIPKNCQKIYHYENIVVEDLGSR